MCLVTHDVLIAEGYNPVTIPILRSLVRKGLDVVVTTSYGVSLSRFSRYCKNQILVPSLALQNEYAKSVEKIVKRMRFNVLFPVFEWSLIPISQNRSRLTPYVKLPIASHEAIVKCFDKSLTIKLAVENDVPIPKTYFAHSSHELKRIAREITYPAVVKPRWSMVWKKDQAFHSRGRYVNSEAELILAYKSLHDYFPFPVVQEYVPGVNYSVAALYNEGKPRAFCCIKVHRAWPVSGGNSCFRESVRLDPEMKDYAERLLKPLDWHGIAEVEFRLDSRDGVPKFMEINPRFWGSLGVAIASGVDFPYLLYRIAVDGDVNGVFDYKVGVKGRYLVQDMLHLVSLFTDASINPVTQNPSRLRAVVKWLKFYEKETFFDLFYRDDPLPFFFSSALFPLGLARFLRQQRYAWSPPGTRS